MIFTKINRNYWQSDIAIELTPEERYFHIYLFTNGNVNTLGCYHFSIKNMVRETGYNEETLEKMLLKMQYLGIIQVDRDTCEVLLLDWGEENWNRKTVTLRAIKSGIKELKSENLLNELTGLLVGLDIMTEEEILDSFHKRARREKEHGNSGEQTGTAGNSGDREGEREGEGEPKEKEKKENTFDREQAFDIFWQAYPKKKDKEAARRRWRSMKVTGEKFREIMAGLEREKRSEQWTANGGQFIPYPAKFLHNGSYLNAVESAPPSAVTARSGGRRQLAGEEQ